MTNEPLEESQGQSTAPPETARQEPPTVGEPAEGKQRPSGTKWALAVCFLAVALAAAVYSGVRTIRQEQRRVAAGSTPMPEGMAPPEPIGSEDAKLKSEVCLGHCLSPLFKPFVECAEAWPDKIRAELYAYESQEGQALIQAHGETLACIFFNGENRFTIGDEGDSREVHFHGPPGEGYTLRDLEDVLRTRLEEIYGAVPEDFEEIAAVLHSDRLAVSGADGESRAPLPVERK